MTTWEGVVLDPAGAAFFPDSGVLAVADLHLGYEAAHRARGVSLPLHEEATLVPVLDRLLDRHQPDVVVVNGDLKHAGKRRVPDETALVGRVWKRLTARARVVLVEGNHDVGLRAALPEAEIVPAFRAGARVFAHGHHAKGLSREKGDGLVLGHEHPALDLRDAVGARVRVRAFLARAPSAARGATLVLPALGPWAAGVDVLRGSGFMGPLLARADPAAFRALALNGDDVLDFGGIDRLRALPL